MDADHTTRFARVDFRNDNHVFGIKDEARFLHVYVIGKTGTGKSSLCGLCGSCLRSRQGRGRVASLRWNDYVEPGLRSWIKRQQAAARKLTLGRGLRP
jgi:hypothetical protein